MENKVKIAIVATLLVTVAYAMYLLVLSIFIDLAVERSLTFFSPNWLVVPLPFEVSVWWNLLLCPLAIMSIVYFYSKEIIVGKEPRGLTVETGCKYNNRLHVYLMNAVSIFAGLGTMILAAIFSPCLTESSVGPLSMLVSGIIVWFGTYIAGSIWISFATCFFTWNNFMDDEFYFTGKMNLIERYKITLASYAKLGIIKTFPFVFGITIGLICRLIVDEIVIVFKSIKISYKKEKITL